MLNQLQSFGNLNLLFIATITTPAVELLHSFVLPDFAFMLNMFIIVLIDTALGVILAFKTKQVSSSEFAKIFTKVLVYCLLVIAVHTVSHFKINGETQLLTWLDSFIYSGIMVRELLSILEKTQLLGYFTAPKWILERLKVIQDKVETPPAEPTKTAAELEAEFKQLEEELKKTYKPS